MVCVCPCVVPVRLVHVHAYTVWMAVAGVPGVDRGGVRAGVAGGPDHRAGAGRLHRPRGQGTKQLACSSSCCSSLPVVSGFGNWRSQELVRAECERWAGKGVDVRHEAREGGRRRGYKAGALREGMARAYARGCDLVAIFDADFRPEPDFLRRAVPFLLHNPGLALVQARWTFGEC